MIDNINKGVENVVIRYSYKKVLQKCKVKGEKFYDFGLDLVYFRLALAYLL